MTVSEIKWREPQFGEDTGKHHFSVGDRVRIARLADNMTTRDIIGHRGIVTDLDDIAPNSVEVACATCRGVHTMHEQELDYFGDDLVQVIQEKSGVPLDAPTVDGPMANLDDLLAVAMHKAGFGRVCIQDKPVQHADPDYPAPVWQKHVYGVIGRIAPFRVYADLLIKIARQAGGYLVEWSSYSYKGGYNSVITADDLDTLTLEMPIRATMVSQRNTRMEEYDDIKDMVAYWLQDKHQIDIGAIFRAVREVGFTMGQWDQKTEELSGLHEYTLRLTWTKADGRGWDTFRSWALAHWEWVGSYRVYISDAGARMIPYSDCYVKKEDGAAKVEVIEEEDVPF